MKDPTVTARDCPKGSRKEVWDLGSVIEDDGSRPREPSIREVFTFGPDQARRNVVEGAPTAYASAIHIRE